jgi:hypothetical protein
LFTDPSDKVSDDYINFWTCPIDQLTELGHNSITNRGLIKPEVF